MPRKSLVCDALTELHLVERSPNTRRSIYDTEASVSEPR